VMVDPEPCPELVDPDTVTFTPADAIARVQQQQGTG
jgi:hypothetical protein